jgi:hypothetical protein
MVGAVGRVVGRDDDAVRQEALDADAPLVYLGIAVLLPAQVVRV